MLSQGQASYISAFQSWNSLHGKTAGTYYGMTFTGARFLTPQAKVPRPRWKGFSMALQWASACCLQGEAERRGTKCIRASSQVVPHVTVSFIRWHSGGSA